MLQTLIDRLKALPHGAVVTNGFHEAMSYRGYYSELGLSPSGYTGVDSMIEVLEGALGETFTGYKGGEYTMEENTGCYLAHYGSCGSKIVGLELSGRDDNEYSLVLVDDSF